MKFIRMFKNPDIPLKWKFLNLIPYKIRDPLLGFFYAPLDCICGFCCKRLTASDDVGWWYREEIKTGKLKPICTHCWDTPKAKPYVAGDR